MNEEERPGGEHGQDELIAPFAALVGRLSGDEFMRLMGSGDYDGTLVRLAVLLLGSDSAAAQDVARDSLAALQCAWSRLGDPGKARAYLRQAIVNRSRSVRRNRAASGRTAPDPAPDTPGAGHAAAGSPDRNPWLSAVRAFPGRQREAVVLCTYLHLSQEQAAQAMGISTRAVCSHLARGMPSLPALPPPGMDPADPLSGSLDSSGGN